MPNRVFAFLDTNVLIHGKFFEQVAWLKLLDADAVVLVLTSTVLHEVDKLKDGAEGKFSRNRAKDFVARFRKYEDLVHNEDGARVHDNVWVRVLPHEPTIRQGFDPNVRDDRIINSILDFKASGSQRVLLISRDLMIRIKAGSNGIDKIPMPDAIELKAELDETERELEATRKELDRLRNRVPRISLRLLQGGLPVDHMQVRLRMPRVRTTDEIEREVLNERQKCAHLLTLPFSSVLAPRRERLQPHLDAFRTYVEALETSVRERWRRVPIHLQLRNEGTVLSERTEIDLEVVAPFEFGPFKTGPVLPRRPNFRTGFLGLGSPITIPRFPAEANQLEPSVLRHKASYLLTELMHNATLNLLPFDVHVPLDWKGAGFSLSVVVRVREVSSPQLSEFNMRTTMLGTEPVRIPEGEEAPEHEGLGTPSLGQIQ